MLFFSPLFEGKSGKIQIKGENIDGPLYFWNYGQNFFPEECSSDHTGQNEEKIHFEKLKLKNGNFCDIKFQKIPEIALSNLII